MNSIQLLKRGSFQAIKNVFNIPSPVIWSNKITFRCNYRCRFCNIWKKDSRRELSTPEAIEFIRQAAKLGVVFNCFEGGEPLMREDLPELLAETERCGMLGSIITNGSLLKGRIDDIKEYLNVITISLDGMRSTHNFIRRSDKAFDYVSEAIDESKAKSRIYINCTLNKKNVDEVTDLAEFASDKGIYIAFCPAFHFQDTEDLSPDEKDLRKAIGEIRTLKANGKPIVNSKAYLDTVYKGESFTCKTGHMFLNSDPFGNVIFQCFCWGDGFNSIGSIREKSLRDIWFSPEAEKFRKEAAACNGCNFIDYVEAAIAMRPRLDILVHYLSLWNKM